MKRTVCFGEVMLRLSAPGYFRLKQSIPGTLGTAFAGAEINAAVTIAALGGAVDFVTALPRNEITDACLANLRSVAVGTSGILQRTEGRFGIYFVETGANQRAGFVHYDREGTTFSVTSAGEYNWTQLLAGAGAFHSSGISCSVSRIAAEATLAAVRAAKSAGVTVSFDLNHRRKLWRWDANLEPQALAQKTLSQILPSVDIAIGNAMDFAAAVGFDAVSWDGSVSNLDPIKDVGRAVARQYPNLSTIAITLRENHSATHNSWGAMLFQPRDNLFVAEPRAHENYAPYQIKAMVDRVGAGDAFAGALLFALQTPELRTPHLALRFAVAASCLAHSIPGDFNYCTRTEVEDLMNGNAGGWVSR
jgi:2-dehydro-3-deoxygluconokinase